MILSEQYMQDFAANMERKIATVSDVFTQSAISSPAPSPEKTLAVPYSDGSQFRLSASGLRVW